MIVLANRPGFPFLGNDFFGTLGKNNNENNNKNINNTNNLSNNAEVAVTECCCVLCHHHNYLVRIFVIPTIEKENIGYSEGSFFFCHHLGKGIGVWLHIEVSLIPEPIFSNNYIIHCCSGPLSIKHKIRNGL